MSNPSLIWFAEYGWSWQDLGCPNSPAPQVWVHKIHTEIKGAPLHYGYYCTNIKTSESEGCPGAKAFKKYLLRAIVILCILAPDPLPPVMSLKVMEMCSIAACYLVSHCIKEMLHRSCIKIHVLVQELKVEIPPFSLRNSRVFHSCIMVLTHPPP